MLNDWRGITRPPEKTKDFKMETKRFIDSDDVEQNWVLLLILQEMIVTLAWITLFLVSFNTKQPESAWRHMMTMLLNDLHIDLIAVHEWSNMKLRCHTLSYGAQEAIVSMPWNQATGADNKYLMSRKDGHQQPDLQTNSKMENRSRKHRWQKPVGHHLSQHNWRQNQTRGRQRGKKTATKLARHIEGDRRRQRPGGCSQQCWETYTRGDRALRGDKQGTHTHES